MNIFIGVVFMIALAFGCINIGQLKEQERYCEIMIRFFRTYEKEILEEHKDFQRGVFFLNDYLKKSFMRNVGDE